MMAIPPRGTTGHGTYFATFSVFSKQQLLQSEQMARLLVDVILQYRDQKKYFLHAFVVMPDHVHLLITPEETLERAIQCVKGGFSFRAKRELGYGGEIWQHSFHDHRIRDAAEFENIKTYIHQNPVQRHLVSTPAEYQFCSAHPVYSMDDVPQRL